MKPLDQTSLEKALHLLGQLLQDRQQHYEVVAVGGGGLLLLGLITRPTKDLDLIAHVDKGRISTINPLPKPLLQAIKEIGVALGLREDWVNNEPFQLFEMGLPNGFETRWHTLHYGGLTVHLASRFDQICFKLYAAVDQGFTSKHFADLKHLKPTKQELTTAARWCCTHDVSEGFALLLQDMQKAFEE